MKKILLSFVLLILLVGLFVPSTSAGNQEYYRLKFQNIFDTMQHKDAQHEAVWNSVNTDAVLVDNGWWIKPLTKKLIEYSGYPFTVETMTRYANTWSWEWGVNTEETCKQTLIRDAQAKGKFPTNNDFYTCVVSPAQWIAAYANNVSATQKTFDVPPPVFAINQWPWYWKTTEYYK